MLALRHVALVSLLTVAVACTVSTQTAGDRGFEPAGDVEAAPTGEPSESETASGDAGKDAGKPNKDGSTPTADGILGTLSGSCGTVKAQLTSSSPSFEQNTLTFVAGETYEKASLSPDGQRMFETPNAGGSSVESEVMSIEVLRACAGATLLKTETEVAYNNDDAGPATITDILVEIGGQKVGVSVTRAYKPPGKPFPDSEVKALLEKKLEGIVRSSQRVMPQDKWVKQVLHVFAATSAQADAVVRVLPTISAALRADTIVLLTKTTGGGFVYCNPDPPLGSECSATSAR